MKPNPVILFDLDGVLIRPGGYRAALRATIETVYRRMGLDDAPPGNDVWDRLEAQGITNEWDMAAFCVALALEQAMDRVGHATDGSARIHSTGWDQLDFALEAIKEWNLGHLEIDYSFLGELAGFVGQQVTPSAALLAAARRGEKTFLKRLLSYPGLLDELFANIEDVARAPLTHLHQRHVVGSQEFARAYHLPVQVEIPSCLELYDQPLLDPARREALLAQWRAGKLGNGCFHRAGPRCRRANALMGRLGSLPRQNWPCG